MIKDKLIRILSSNQIDEFLKFYKDDEDYLNKINNDWIKIKKNLNTDKLTAKMLYNYITNYYKYKGLNLGIAGGARQIKVPENKISKDNIDMSGIIPMDVEYEPKQRKPKKPKTRTSKGRASRGGRTYKGKSGIHQIVKVYLASQQEKPTIISSSKPSHIVDTRSTNEKNKAQQQQQLPSINISPNISPSITSTISPHIKPTTTINPVIKPLSVVKPSISSTIKPIIKPTLHNSPSFIPSFTNEPKLTATISTNNNPSISPLFEVNNKPVSESSFYQQQEQPVEKTDEPTMETEEPSAPVYPTGPPPTDIPIPPDIFSSPFIPQNLIPKQLLHTLNQQEHTDIKLETNNEETSFLDPSVWATQGGGGAEPPMDTSTQQKKRLRKEITPTPPRPKKGEKKEEDVKVSASETIEEEEEYGISGQQFFNVVDSVSKKIINKLEKEGILIPEQTEISGWLNEYIHSKSPKVQRKYGKNTPYYQNIITDAFITAYKRKHKSIKKEN